MLKKTRKLIFAISGGSAAILVIYLLRQRCARTPRPAARETLIKVDEVLREDSIQVDEVPATDIPDKPTADSSVPAPQADDLKRIEGIGPKTAAILNQAGISSFQALAALPPEEIKDILRAAKVRGVPTTWPQQAKLAAATDWDSLDKLQAQLKGGRR
ncbi:MAG: DUF4332 domain-containing protein [Anaerolineaceae bacterium]|jgi:predicted flap endonuclease-1-like 5' DNA nuclease|nr:DUF4332 domain-containing protein [Anaerolineaceae bacterium]